MARFDIMPATPDVPIRYYPVGSSKTFKHGEPLILSSGLLSIATSAIASDAGIAGTPADTLSGWLVAAADATVTTFPGGVATTASLPTGTLLPCYYFRPGDQAVCKNYSVDTNGTGAAAAITSTSARGLNGSFTVDAASTPNWYFSSGSTLAHATISRVLPVATTTAGLGRYDDTATTSLAASSFVVVVTFTRDIT